MDLRTTYLGLELAHPVVASASPLARTCDGVLRLADAGAAAVVMPSVYEEQIRAEEALDTLLSEQGADSQPEAMGYFPDVSTEQGALDARLEVLAQASERAGVPVIASLNGATRGGWVDFAAKLEQAGAAAIELNLYQVPADPSLTSADVEERYLEIVRAVCASVKVPVAVKLSPFLSSPGNLIRRIIGVGAAGVVLFNRFYEADIDLSTLRAKSDLELSTAYDIRLPLTWIGLISQDFEGSIAATSGVQSSDEVVKYLLAGADVVMTTSSLLRHGPEHIGQLRDGLSEWMQARGFESVGDLRGRLAADRNPASAEAMLRAQYHTILTTSFPDVALAGRTGQ